MWRAVDTPDRYQQPKTAAAVAAAPILIDDVNSNDGFESVDVLDDGTTISSGAAIVRDVDLESLIDARAEAKVKQQREEVEAMMKQEREKIRDMVKGLLLSVSSPQQSSRTTTNNHKKKKKKIVPNSDEATNDTTSLPSEQEQEQTDDYTEESSLLNDISSDDDDDDDPEEVRLKALALLERIGFNDESETSVGTNNINFDDNHPLHHHHHHHRQRHSLRSSSSLQSQQLLQPQQPQRQSMVQNQYHHVTYCRQRGTLLVSTSHLSFISTDGSVSTTWSWNGLGKINTNRIMRIQQLLNSKDHQSQPSQKLALFLEFENPQDLTAAATEFRRLIQEAAANTNTKLSANTAADATTITTATTASNSASSSRNPSHHHHLPQHQEQQQIMSSAVVPPPPPPTATTTSRAEEQRIVKGLVKRLQKAMEESIDSRAEAMTASIHATAKTIVEDLLQKERMHYRTNHNNNNNSRSNMEMAPNVELMPLYRAGDREEAPFEDEDQQLLLVPPGEAKNNDNDNNDEDEDEDSYFGESVYTLFFLYECRSQSFFYSLVIYGFQMATICFTLVDIQDDGIPQMVPLVVTFTQAMTIFMLVAYMTDLIEAVLKLQHGYSPRILRDYPGATYATWLFSCLAQLLAGLLVMVGCFVLTMQASTVIDLMLNLTALLFISEIDDIGFAMARMGFITDVIQKEALAVVDFRMPKNPYPGIMKEFGGQNCTNLNRRLLYLLNLLALFAGYAYLKDRQLNGYYLPTYLYVQFGDAYNERIPYYSGILSSGNVRTPTHRVYWDETHTISLAYCVEEKSWTFSEVNDPCQYFARSFETETYDVTDIPDSDWEIKDEFDRLLPFDSFSLVSRDCDPISCQGTCGDDGGLCECPHDRFGMDCEFPDVCHSIKIDDRPGFEPFPTLKINHLYATSHEFEILLNDETGEHVQVSNMPVYYSNKTFPANFIFFGGRRWVFSTEFGLFNLTQAKMENPGKHFFKEKTVAILQNDFHGYHQSGSQYVPMYISDPVDFETPKFQATPIGLRWWTVEIRVAASLKQFIPDVALETYLKCNTPPATCMDKPQGFCIFGSCNKESGLCDCIGDYRGDRCSMVKPCYETLNPCGGNGACDTTGSGLCRCNDPYFGAACEARSKCYEEGGRCQNDGVCDEVSGECSCRDDWAGYACEKRAEGYDP